MQSHNFRRVEAHRRVLPAHICIAHTSSYGSRIIALQIIQKMYKTACTSSKSVLLNNQHTIIAYSQLRYSTVFQHFCNFLNVEGWPNIVK
jgi:hypothetical protein